MSVLYPLILTLCLTFIAAADQSALWLPVDSNGWSTITPSNDSRLIHVSNSEGNDSTGDGSINNPYKTIAKGLDFIRDGQPDHLLLKRGDSWSFPSNTTVLGRFVSGRSASEPAVVAAYGNASERPQIRCFRFINTNGSARNHVAFIGLDIYNVYGDPTQPEYQKNLNVDDQNTWLFRYVSFGGQNLLIEDCKIRFRQTSIQGGSSSRFKNAVLRRNHGSSMGH